MPMVTRAILISESSFCCLLVLFLSHNAGQYQSPVVPIQDSISHSTVYLPASLDPDGTLISFAWPGTSIAVYGSIPPNNTAVSTYTIDTASPVIITNSNITQYTSGQLFFQSPELEDGGHTLAVIAPDTVIGNAATQFYFDYLSYIASVPSSNATVPVASADDGRSSRSVNLKTVLPAVLIPCISIILLLGLGLYVQRRRVRILYAKSESDENVSYKQLESGER